MGNNEKFKYSTSKKTENSQQQTGTHYFCNYPCDPGDSDLPPPAPPNGRDDLWELQFCRWWGWNWVRRKDYEGVYKDTEPKSPKGCTSSKRRKEYETHRPSIRKQSPPSREFDRPEYCSKSSPTEVNRQTINRQTSYTRIQETSPLPPKEELKRMCKCLIGKKRKTPCGMANLFNTPSASVVAVNKRCYGVADKSVFPVHHRPICNSTTCKRKTRREEGFENRCKVQSWSEVLEEPQPEVTPSDEINHEPLSSQKNCSSTEESIEYLSVRLQHVTSDHNCPCRNHCSPDKKKIQDASKEIEKNHLEVQTSLNVYQDHKETQTYSPEVQTSLQMKQTIPCTEKVFKLKGKKHKTICICICCCGVCKPTSTNDSKKCPGRDSSNKRCSASKENDSSSKDNFTKNLDLSNDSTVAYNFLASPTNTKKLSKFGTPSKNYPWIQNIGSDATTTTLNNYDVYKSPATGKTYDFATLKFDNHDNITLPDLIDISEDLSYLKKLECATKSEDENRLLLDAVCDAILQEHQDKSLDFFTDDEQLTRALNRDYKDLGILCDLKKDFDEKIDAFTDLNELILNRNKDAEIQLSNTCGMAVKNSDVKLGQIDCMLDNLLESIVSSPNVNTKNPVFSGIPDCATEKSLILRRDDKFKASEDVFFRTGLLSSRTTPKSIKREPEHISENSNENNTLKEVKNTINPDQNATVTDHKIGTIFTKIEDIVKKSKLKSAEIQKVLSCVPSKHDMNECVLQTYSLNNCDLTQNSSAGKIVKIEDNSKRSYKISSDAFKGELCESTLKQTEPNNFKKSYDFFGAKMPFSSEDRKEHCSATAAETILEEDSNNTLEENKQNESSETCVEKVSKLSVQNFLVCDEKSSQKTCTGGGYSKVEKKMLKKKRVNSKGSLIPVRKRSYSGGNH